MNKSYILLSLLLVLSLNYDIVKSVTYLDMTPYEKIGCSEGDPAGIGYSFIVNQCFAIEETFYMVELNHDHSNATINQYEDNKCKRPVNDTDRTYIADECYSAPNYVWNNFVQPNNYVKISISVNPTYIPQYGHRQTTYAPGDTNCVSNPWFYWYATNYTKLSQYSSTDLFTCIDNISYETLCEPGCYTIESTLSCTALNDLVYGNVAETC